MPPTIQDTVDSGKVPMTVGRKCRSVEVFSTADYEEDLNYPQNLWFVARL